jgi:hypothetical protein
MASSFFLSLNQHFIRKAAFDISELGWNSVIETRRGLCVLLGSIDLWR